MVAKARVGILALQGDTGLHRQSLERLGITDIVMVKRTAELKKIQGLIIPGGESTTLLNLAEPLGMLEAIREFAKAGGNIFGTCAGAILLAGKVSNPPQKSLGLLDVRIERNGYGRQLESQEAAGSAVPELGTTTLPMTFIRAPRITEAGKGVKVLATYKDDPVLVRQDAILAATFHPELTESTAVYEYWLKTFAVYPHPRHIL